MKNMRRRKTVIAHMTNNEARKMQRYQKKKDKFTILMKNNKGKMLWTLEWDFLLGEVYQRIWDERNKDVV